MREARMEETPHGKRPAGEGWFIVNAGELAWTAVEGGGVFCQFEAPDARSPILGIGVHVVRPGEPSAMYHAESEQEGFLVLAGECIAVVEGEERRMRQWDYLHCPPGTAHITVGAGDGPCAILMVGTRSPQSRVHYPVDEVAARHGASVREPTDSPKEAYAGRPPFEQARAAFPFGD